MPVEVCSCPPPPQERTQHEDMQFKDVCGSVLVENMNIITYVCGCMFMEACFEKKNILWRRV